MKERIYSIETEYAIGHLPKNDSQSMNEFEVFDVLFSALNEKLKFQELRPRTAFLENGSKFYYDSGHAEWALPECRSVRELLIFDKAADRTLKECLPMTAELMKKHGYDGEIFITKNNVDAFGKTYGTHENYLIQRQTGYLEDEKDFFKLLIGQLVPFLVTRQILCGSGKVGFDKIGRKNIGKGYQVSQRADFINSVIGIETTHNRPIINLKDEPFADNTRYRRLHLILGDANMSQWSALLKIGTTGIVLQMLEANFIPGDLALADPVQAIKDISSDLTCEREVLLKDGRHLTPIRIQKEYLESAKKYFHQLESEYPACGKLDSETREILNLWEDTLKKLEIDPNLLQNRLDWVIKKKALEKYKERNKLQWHDARLKQMDSNYHKISQQKSLFYLLEKNNQIEIHPFFDSQNYNEEVNQAQVTPPLYTRARMRGDILKAVKAGKINASVNWNYMVCNNTGKKIRLDDPLCFFNREVYKTIGRKEYHGILFHALDSTDPYVQLRALEALALMADKYMIDVEPMTKLFQLANDKNPLIRFKARETLDRIWEKKEAHLIKSFDQTFSKVWPSAEPPEATF